MIVLFCSLLATIVILTQTLQLGIGPVFTSFKALRVLSKHLPKKLRAGEIVDLGSGFGLTALWLARRYPKHRVIGYELSWIPYLISKIVALFAKNLAFQRKCIYSINLRSKALIYSYLYPKAMARLGQGPPDVFWISYCFAFSKVKHVNKLTVRGLYYSFYYIYK